MSKKEVITKEKIVSIMKEATNSGVSRVERIRINNSSLYDRINKLLSDSEKAEELLKWNEEIVEYFSLHDVLTAKDEIKKFNNTIDSMIADPSNMKDRFQSIKEFRYKYFGKLISLCYNSNASKIIRRINNLKFYIALYNKSDDYRKKYVLEAILNEVHSLKAFFIIYNSNIKCFGNEYFPLANLLYDISAKPDEKIHVIEELRRYGIKI